MMNSLNLKLFRFLLLALLLGGCSTQVKSTLKFNPQEPLRVAVLPFIRVDKNGIISHEESRLVVDNLSIVSKDQSQTPAQIVRKQVLQELKRTGLDLLATPLIDIDLPHNGFIKDETSIDLDKLYKTNASEICTKFLNCDAILYGKIFEWDRSYYGIQSVNSVGIDLQLVSAKTGEVLFASRASDTESRGITQGPTGYTSLVVEPIKGLNSQIIVDLSRKLVGKMLEPLDVTKKPEFLESEPPSIFAASHDAATGVISNELVVVSMGTPGQIASFSVGKNIKDIPMIERSPGHYYGEFLPWPGEKVKNADVTVSLKDKYGRVTSKKISLKPVSL
jgi:hypothetical protein